MKNIFAATIVALAIVFHALTRTPPQEFASPSGEAGWVLRSGRGACLQHSVLARYMESAFFSGMPKETRTLNADRFMEIIDAVKAELHDIPGCDRLVAGQAVTWIPAPAAAVGKIDASEWDPRLAEQDMKFSVVLLKYTSEAGIEKRGYAARSAVRSLADADEPNE